MNNQMSQIIRIFKENVEGRSPDIAAYNARHDGRAGHWLEKKMGIRPNSANEPDIFGYEMKNDTSKKTTFGDWSPDYAIWNKNAHMLGFSRLDRDNEFLRYFGKPNMAKDGRLSWSGEPAPTIGTVNPFGQFLIVDDKDNVCACYSYSKDQRLDKAGLIPATLQRDNLILAKWLKGSLQTKLERKFNNLGWFKCFQNTAGVYCRIGFGEPMTYGNWINLVREGVVFFDSGMYAGNSRPYSQWRANNNYWESLITENYP